MTHEIITGDALIELPKLAERGVVVDAIVTDPPYNIGYEYEGYRDEMPDEEYLAWQLQVLSLAEETLRAGGHFLYLHYPEFAARMFWSAPEVSGLSPFKLITWTYNTHTGGKPLRKGTRLWCWWHKGVGQYLDEDALRGEYKNPTDRRVAQLIAEGRRPVDYDWWHYEQVKNVDLEKTPHPCQLPLEMVMRLVQATTRPGDTVLDPFAGSFTTGEACVRLGRNFIGIEQSEDYCRIGEARMKRASGEWAEIPRLNRRHIETPLFASEGAA